MFYCQIISTEKAVAYCSKKKHFYRQKLKIICQMEKKFFKIFFLHLNSSLLFSNSNILLTFQCFYLIEVPAGNKYHSHSLAGVIFSTLVTCTKKKCQSRMRKLIIKKISSEESHPAKRKAYKHLFNSKLKINITCLIH
jgi:hypothetical protein